MELYNLIDRNDNIAQSDKDSKNAKYQCQLVREILRIIVSFFRHRRSAVRGRLACGSD